MVLPFLQTGKRGEGRQGNSSFMIVPSKNLTIFALLDKVSPAIAATDNKPSPYVGVLSDFRLISCSPLVLCEQHTFQVQTSCSDYRLIVCIPADLCEQTLIIHVFCQSNLLEICHLPPLPLSWPSMPLSLLSRSQRLTRTSARPSTPTELNIPKALASV